MALVWIDDGRWLVQTRMEPLARRVDGEYLGRKESTAPSFHGLQLSLARMRQIECAGLLRRP